MFAPAEAMKLKVKLAALQMIKRCQRRNYLNE